MLHAQAPSASNFTVLVRGAAIGSEQIVVERTAQGWTIASSGRMGPPFNVVLRTLQLRYDADWKPVALSLDATVGEQAAALVTTVTGTTAKNETTIVGASPVESTDSIDPSAVLLPNPFIAPYEALAARLRTAAVGAILAIYQPHGGSFSAEVGASTSQEIQTAGRTIRARRTRLTFGAPNAQVIGIEIWGDEDGRLLRVSIPAQGLDFVREDVASVSARLVTLSRPNDEGVTIPANGFSLAGTVSKPAASTGPLPVAILLSGADPTDRDETTFGIPIFGQIAHALADAGYMVLRYDKRGVGQSGGRAEAATLADFAEDAKASVAFMSARKDADRRRLALVGYGEGGWIALLSAAKNNRVSAVGLLAAVGVTGRELNLYQVTRGVERSNRSASEQQSTIALQRQIQQAVMSGVGWDAINVSPQVRRQADTPYFQSFLNLDPAKAMKDVRQPILIVEGAIDKQVPPDNAERLRTLANGRKNAAPADLVKVAGINHLLAPASTGELDEYGSLPDRTVSPSVTSALVGWLKKTLMAR